MKKVIAVVVFVAVLLCIWVLLSNPPKILAQERFAATGVNLGTNSFGFPITDNASLEKALATNGVALSDVVNKLGPIDYEKTFIYVSVNARLKEFYHSSDMCYAVLEKAESNSVVVSLIKGKKSLPIKAVEASETK
jgi:hypothetical protein